MALKNLNTQRRYTAILEHAPESIRPIVLRSVNPSLASELEIIEKHPDQALTRVRKLDVETVTELLEFVSNPASLAAIAADPRENVGYFTRNRAKDLGVSLTPVVRTAPDIAARTARTLAKPLDSIPNAISRMATIDEAAVALFASTVDAPPDWWDAFLRESCRHTQLCSTLAAIALERQTLSGLAVFNAVPPRTALLVVVSHTGMLNRAHLGVIIAAAAQGFTISYVEASGVAPDALERASSLPVRTRMLLALASIDEIRNEMNRVERLLGTSPDRDSVMVYREIASSARTPEAVALVASFVVNHRNGFAGSLVGVPRTIASELLEHVPGIDTNTKRVLWSLLGSTLLNALDPHEWISKEDEDWLIESFASEDDNGFDTAALLQNNRSEPEPAHAEFVKRLILEAPGSAGVILKNASRFSDWGATTVLAYTAERIGENTRAWSVFTQAVFDWPGLLDDLIVAAIAASE